MDFGLPAFGLNCEAAPPWRPRRSSRSTTSTPARLAPSRRAALPSTPTWAPRLVPPPMAARSRPPRSRCSCARRKKCRTSAGAYAKRAAGPPRVGGTSSGAAPRGVTRRADDACGLSPGRAGRPLHQQAPAIGRAEGRCLARQDLHINVGLPTRTPSSGLPTGFSATSSEEESVAPVPTKVKRSVDSTTSPAPIKSVDTASSPAPWRSPRTSLKSPGFVSPPSVKSPAVTKQQKLAALMETNVKLWESLHDDQDTILGFHSRVLGGAND